VLGIFSDNLLPIFFAVGAGYALSASLRIDARALSQVGFYVFSPCLVYDIIVDTALPSDAVVRMVGFTGVSLLGLAFVTALIARWRGWPRPLAASFILVVLLPNSGNLGLSATLFAFGEPGLAHASVFFVTSAIITFTVGVFIASLGRARVTEALRGLIRVPAIWAVMLALVSLNTGWLLPFPARRATELLAEACIPTFLIILGMQLHGAALTGPLSKVILASSLRLGGGFLWGLMLAFAFGLEDAAQQAAVLQSAMPSAVICIVLASEYDLEPAFATSVVLLTTLMSPFVLTPIVAMLSR
jgi:predicted permease